MESQHFYLDKFGKFIKNIYFQYTDMAKEYINFIDE